MTRSSIELQTCPRSSPPETGTPRHHVDIFSAEAPAGGREFSTPPADGGRQAWLFLAACFMLEALVWGFPFSYGVFQDYYSTHEPFAGSYQIALVGTCAMGIMYLDVPLVMGIQRLYPRQARWSPLAGLLIMCVSLAVSSFSQTVTHLVVTQGIFYAVGGSIAYSPCIMYMDEWFVRRKGFAYGVMWSGTGLAGVVLPMLLQLLLGRYGFRTTLRIWALALFVLAVPLAFFIRPRLPYSANTHLKPFRLDFVLTRTFMLYQACNIAESLGFFLPAIYLPSYARSVLGASAFPAALTILLLNVAAVFGCVVMGHLTDRLHVATCLLISTAGTAVGVFLLWGLATSLPVLYVFCAIYGLFAGSYTSAYPGIMRQVLASEAGRADSQDGAGQSVLDPAMLFAFLAAGRGVGNVVSGPLSEALVRGMPWQGQAAAAYGSGYGPLITFTGTSALVGGASSLWRSMGWL